MTELEVDALCPGKDLQKPRAEEEVARRLFEPHLDAQLHAYVDPPDFFLCRDSRVVGWAEVTTAVDGPSQALLNRLKKDGESFEAEGLGTSWVVSFTTDTRIKNLDRGALVAILKSNEEAPDRRRLEEDLRAVDAAHAVPLGHRAGSPTIYLGPTSFGSSVAPDLVNELAKEKAEAKEESLVNREGERHLLVLVNYDWPGGAGMALTDPDVPEESPELPAWVTEIWMSSIQGLIWHAAAGRPWQIIDTR